DEVLKSTNTDAAIAGVKRAVASGRITSERLDLSVRRILAAKARLHEAEPDLERIFRVVDSPAHRAVVEEIARRSVTLVRESPGALPLDRRAEGFLVGGRELERAVGTGLLEELRNRPE